MKLIYHPITVVSERTIADKHFLLLSQQIDATTPDGWDAVEVKLFGFSQGESTITRTLNYELSSDLNREEFEEVLASYPQARIIRQISHEPIVSTQEQHFVAAKMIDIERIAKRQIVRNGDSVYIDRHGMPVYAQNKLSLTGEYEDQDYRSPIPESAVEVQLPIDVPVYTHQHE